VKIALKSPKPDAAKAEARISSALSRLRGGGRQNPGNYGGLTSGFEYLDQPRAMLAQHLLWLTRHTPRQNGLTE